MPAGCRLATIARHFHTAASSEPTWCCCCLVPLPGATAHRGSEPAATHDAGSAAEARDASSTAEAGEELPVDLRAECIFEYDVERYPFPMMVAQMLCEESPPADGSAQAASAALPSEKRCKFVLHEGVADNHDVAAQRTCGKSPQTAIVWCKFCRRTTLASVETHSVIFLPFGRLQAPPRAVQWR